MADNEDKQRIPWLDTLKGLGILCVVFGHSGHPYAYLVFTFHMPLFFFISGYLYQSKAPLGSYLFRRARQLLLPYIFYTGVITLCFLCYDFFHARAIFWQWDALLLGGSKMEGAYGAFWFVTCLFATQILYHLLCRFLRSPWLISLAVIVCFFIAFWESRYHEHFFFPWNLDVGLFGLVFYALGVFLRRKKGLVNKPVSRCLLIGGTLIYAVYLFAHLQYGISFGLDLKHRQYYYLGWNLLIPLAGIMTVCALSMLLTRLRELAKILGSLGQASLVIMFLHVVVNQTAAHYIAITPGRFLFIGLVAPWCWYALSSRAPLLSVFACGIVSKSIKTRETWKNQ